jgi:aspartate ammonia-lyase
MPGKVNPVIPEAVAQAAIAVMGNDLMIVQAVGGGNLELSQFLPLVADSLLASIDLLTNACDIFARHCVSGIEADVDHCSLNVRNSTAVLTALVDEIGYDAAEQLAHEAARDLQDIRQLAIDRGLLTAEKFDELVSPERVTKLGS